MPCSPRVPRRKPAATTNSYVCYDKEITREFIDACAMWSKALAIAASDISNEEVFEDQDEDGNTREIKAFRIDYASGFKIVALPSVPRSIRGRKGVVGIDEAAYVTNLAGLLKAALALLMWGGRVAIASSHNGTESPFNLLIDDIRAGRRKGGVHTTTFARALSDGLYERYCLVNRIEPTPQGKFEYEKDIRDFYGEDAAEELDCIPSPGGGAFISPELVAAAQHADAGKPEGYDKGLCVIGRDIAAGRGGDLAVMWVFELVGNVMWLRQRVESRYMDLTEQERVFNGLMKNFRVLRAGLDQSSMGEGETLRAIQRHGSRVEGVLFSPANRLDMAMAMKKRFEDGTIRIPDDAKIRADFRAIKKVTGAGSVVRLVNDGKVHADMFWACALACLVADLDAPACRGYEPAPRKHKFAERRDIDSRSLSPGRMKMRASEERGSSSGGRFGKGAW